MKKIKFDVVSNPDVVTEVTGNDLGELAKSVNDNIYTEDSDISGKLHTERAFAMTVDKIRDRFPNLEINVDESTVVDVTRTDSEELAANDAAIMEIFQSLGMFAGLNGLTTKDLATVPMSVFAGTITLNVYGPWGDTRLIDISFLKYCTQAGQTSGEYVWSDGFAGAVNVVKAELPPNIVFGGSNWAASSSVGFLSKTSIEEIRVPASVPNIGSGFCRECTKLKYADIGHMTGKQLGGVHESKVYRYAFYKCTALESVNISSLAIIYPSMFEGCSNLLMTELPPSVERIDAKAFSGCNKITKLKLPMANIPTVASNSFPNVTHFYVPTELVDAYKEDSQWSVYASRIHDISEY